MTPFANPSQVVLLIWHDNCRDCCFKIGVGLLRERVSPGVPWMVRDKLCFKIFKTVPLLHFMVLVYIMKEWVTELD